MPRIDRIPRLDTRTRRAFGGIGMDFVPYTGAIKDVDLGAFNLTTTGVITAANLVLSDKNGIDFTHATDEDIDIIELSGITGDPKIYWDESEDRFRFTKGLFVDVNVGILGTLSVVGLATVGELNVDTLNLSGNVISDSTGTISFDNENLITTGTMGIGTASPTGSLEIVTQASGTYPFYLTAYNDVNPIAGFVGRSARGTLDSPTATQSGNYLFVLAGRGHDGSGFASGNSNGVIQLQAAENFTAAAQGTTWSFIVMPKGTTTQRKAQQIWDTGEITCFYDVAIAKGSAPLVPLDIGAVASGFTRVIKVGLGTTTADAGYFLEFPSSTVDGYGARIGGIRTGVGTGANSLIFQTGTNAQTTKWTIDNSGHLFSGIDGTGVYDVTTAGDVSIMSDSKKLILGTGNDATIYYDGTDLRLDSRKVGTGNVVVSDSLMVNYDSVGGGVVEHLILNGSSGDDPEARGGSIKWNKWGSGVAGYTFANADGRVVWDTTEQASRTDAGNAWVGFDGSSHFGSSTVGDATNYTEIKTDGEINLHGTARVIRHLRVGAASWDKGAAAPTAGFEGVFSTLDFDAVLDDEAHYTIIVPYRWDSTVDVEFAVDWFYDGGQDNGTVCWGLEYKAIKAGEAVTGAGTTITKVSAGTHTTGQMVRTTFTTKILAANLEAGDTIGFRLYRDVSGDTLATDARLINTHFHFTMNKLGEAT